MIRIAGLVKRFGAVTALDGLDLSVPKGTVLGLLGPNGAGKTTAVRVMTTLIEPDGGTVEVAGLDVRREPGKVRERIGLSGQTAAVDEHLTGFENLEMVGRLYHLGRKPSQARARQLLERFDLDEAGDRVAKTYSGGMRRRLDLAAALVASPEVLFLDEPTTGLDPRSRAAMWDTIRELVRGGSTVLLTTQYMEEADQLADDIVVIDHGKVIGHGTSDELKAKVGGERIEVVVEDALDIPIARQLLEAMTGCPCQVDQEGHRLTVAVGGGADSLREALLLLKEREVEVRDVGLRRPTLDDVFLTLTGHAAEEVPEEADQTPQREKEAVR
jgi:ABC-2 type transport system ATP-binding protein